MPPEPHAAGRVPFEPHAANDTLGEPHAAPGTHLVQSEDIDQLADLLINDSAKFQPVVSPLRHCSLGIPPEGTTSQVHRPTATSHGATCATQPAWHPEHEGAAWARGRHGRGPQARSALDPPWAEIRPGSRPPAAPCCTFSLKGWVGGGKTVGFSPNACGRHLQSAGR